MKLTLGFSPCPNDTFIFDALVNKKIDTGEFEFEIYLEDVQTLNQWALEKKLAITKISYGVFPLITGNYNLLDSGGALGKGVGPLVIAKNRISFSDVNKYTVAIPGKNTTAHLLFSMAFPAATKKEFMIFSSIEDAVLKGEVNCGVIIHENRFTYQQKGLIKIIDLGEHWETETGYPIPLGGIVMRNDHQPEIQKRINALIKQSVEFAFSNYPLLTNFVKQHSQEMDEHVMRQHIDLYVNNYSITLGKDGELAIEKLMDIYSAINKSAPKKNFMVVN
jgi:1,4-dihydroxy-6-naphthoate synthase